MHQPCECRTLYHSPTHRSLHYDTLLTGSGDHIKPGLDYCRGPTNARWRGITVNSIKVKANSSSVYDVGYSTPCSRLAVSLRSTFHPFFKDLKRLASYWFFKEQPGLWPCTKAHTLFGTWQPQYINTPESTGPTPTILKPTGRVMDALCVVV